MSKPVWEEDWVYRDGALIEESFDPYMTITPGYIAAKERLKSAAPDMVRLLLQHEFPNGWTCYHRCGATRGEFGVPHAENCEWLRVMKKAGVR